MAQSLFLSILILFLSSFASIHASNKSQPAKSPSPVATPAPGPSNSDCSTIIYDMMGCISYLTPGSNDTKPTKECCGGILSVLQYNPKCICVGIASSKDMGIALNNTRTLAMPTTCKLSIASPRCPMLHGGASTPGMSPGSPSAGTPMNSPSSSVGSPTSSSSLADSPGTTAPSPSSSGTDYLSVSTLTLVAVIVSSITYISAFSN